MFVDFNILNQLGSPSINSNTFANRPSAGQVGRLFVSTDTFEIYRDNGTGWDLIGGPGSSTVTGSGTAGTIPLWTGTNAIGNSDLRQLSSEALILNSATNDWPTTQLLNDAGRILLTSATQNPMLICWGKSAFGSGNEEGTLALGNVTALGSTTIGGGIISGFIENNTDGAGSLQFRTTNTSGLEQIALTINSSQVSTFTQNVIVNSPGRIGVHTAIPGASLDVHSAADVGFQLNGTGATPSILQEFLSIGVVQYQMGYNWNSDINYRRFAIYDSVGAKEVISIDQQSRFVGVNYQYTSLSDQPAYTFDVSGSIRATDTSYIATNASNYLLVGSTTLSAGNETLQVTGSAKVTNSIYAVGAEKALIFQRTVGSASDQYSISANASSAYLYNETTASILMTWLEGGNVGIGVNNPLSKLDVAVPVEVPATGAVALIARTSNGANDIFRWYDGTSQLGVIKNNGNFLIGTTIDGGAKLTVNGATSINTTTNGLFSKLIVAGSIHCDNNTTAATTNQNQYGNFYGNQSTVIGGAGATTIYSSCGPEGSLYVVSGFKSTGARFVDLVLVLGALTTAPVVVSSQTYAGPATRTYTNTGETIKLELSGTDTYTIFVTGMGCNEKT
jgi:hypothetical protein